MTTIFQILSNVKHDGENLAKGSFIEADLAAFQSLVEAGIMRVVEGAKSLADAAAIVADEEAAKLEAAQAPEAAAAPDTWGPTKEPVVAPEGETTGPVGDVSAPAAPVLARFTVLKEFEVTNPESKNFGKHAIGEVIEADPAAAQSLVDSGTLALEGTPTGDNL